MGRAQWGLKTQVQAECLSDGGLWASVPELGPEVYSVHSHTTPHPPNTHQHSAALNWADVVSGLMCSAWAEQLENSPSVAASTFNLYGDAEPQILFISTMKQLPLETQRCQRVFNIFVCVCEHICTICFVLPLGQQVIHCGLRKIMTMTLKQEESPSERSS